MGAALEALGGLSLFTRIHRVHMGQVNVPWGNSVASMELLERGYSVERTWVDSL